MPANEALRRRDVSDQIDSIVWNVYGKIERVVRTSSSSKSDLEFRYDAMGNRICKIVKPRAGAGVLSQDNWTYTYYLRDASGNVIAVYDRDFEHDVPGGQFTDELAVKEEHLYGSSRVGIRSIDDVVATTTYTYSSTAGNGLLVGTYVGLNSIAASTTNWSHELKRKSYELSNHLGNVLVTVSDARTANNSGGTITTFNGVVESAQDYYAFGSSMVGRSVSGDYRYSFNGKEKENEIAEGDLDFGARVLDVRLGRWLSPDMYEGKYASYSTYSFAANNPMSILDPEGDSIYILNNGKLYNVSTAEGAALAERYGYKIASRTETGGAVLRKYQNSSTRDIYIGTGTSADPFADKNLAGQQTTTAGAATLNGTAALYQNGAIVVDEAAKKKHPNGRLGQFDEFNGVKVQNPGATVNLISFNPEYLAHQGTFAGTDQYDVAESLLHEVMIHVDRHTGNGAKDHIDAGVPPDTDVGIITKSGTSGGIPKLTMYDSGELVKGSLMDKVVLEVLKVKQIDKSPKPATYTWPGPGPSIPASIPEPVMTHPGNVPVSGERK